MLKTNGFIRVNSTLFSVIKWSVFKISKFLFWFQSHIGWAENRLQNVSYHLPSSCVFWENSLPCSGDAASTGTGAGVDKGLRAKYVKGAGVLEVHFARVHSRPTRPCSVTDHLSPVQSLTLVIHPRFSH